MSPGCTTQEVEARRQMVLRTHPLHCKRDEDIKPTMISPSETLALLLEAKEQYGERLKVIDREIAILRDVI